MEGLLIRVQTFQRMIYAESIKRDENGEKIRSLDTLNKAIFSSLEEISIKLNSDN